MGRMNPDSDWDGGWNELEDTGDDFETWASEPIDETNLAASWQAGRVQRGRDGDSWYDVPRSGVAFDQTGGRLPQSGMGHGDDDATSSARTTALTPTGRALLNAANPGTCQACGAPISFDGSCGCS